MQVMYYRSSDGGVCAAFLLYCTLETLVLAEHKTFVTYEGHNLVLT